MQRGSPDEVPPSTLDSPSSQPGKQQRTSHEPPSGFSSHTPTRAPRRTPKLPGRPAIDTNATAEVFPASGVSEIDTRYVSVVWWNDSGQALSGTAGDHETILTAVPDEAQ